MLAFSSPAFPSPYAPCSLCWLPRRVATVPGGLQSHTGSGQRGTVGRILGTLDDAPGRVSPGSASHDGEG